MKVFIEVTEWLSRFTGGKTRIELELAGVTDALHAVLKTGIPEWEIGFITLHNEASSAGYIIINKEYILRDGDKMKVYPLIIGG